MKTYNRRTCHICGCDTSTAGAAFASHMRKHVREGRAVEVKRNYGKRYGVEITYEKVKLPTSKQSNTENGAAVAGVKTPIADSPASAGWAHETMMAINRLTPEVKEKAFDPDWFLLRQRLEQAETVMKTCESALRSYQYGNGSTELAEEVADKAHNVLKSKSCDFNEAH